MIIKFSRGHLLVKIGEKIARVEGELCESMSEDANFEYIVYMDSIKKWEKPYDDLDITVIEKMEIIEVIRKEMKTAKARAVFI